MTRHEHLLMKIKAAKRELVIRERAKNAADRAYEKILKTIGELNGKLEKS